MFEEFFYWLEFSKLFLFYFCVDALITDTNA